MWIVYYAEDIEPSAYFLLLRFFLKILEFFYNPALKSPAFRRYIKQLLDGRGVKILRIYFFKFCMNQLSMRFADFQFWKKVIH